MKRSGPSSKCDLVSLLDEAMACCQNITTLGQLLAAAGTGTKAIIEVETVVKTGEMIAEESGKLNELIQRLGGPEREAASAGGRRKPA